jgi:hypothetical protein
MEAKLKEAEWIQSRYDQLNLIEEKKFKRLMSCTMLFKKE